MTDHPRIEYIEARRVSLDALGALREQLGAVVLVGAQAVYLCTGDLLPAYQPFTTDADIVLDPSLLTDQPALGDVMRNAGFVLTPEPGIWEARFRRVGLDDEVVVPVDLIVPMQVAAGRGRRSARLGGAHGKHSARRAKVWRERSSITAPSRSTPSIPPTRDQSLSTWPAKPRCWSPSGTARRPAGET